MTRILALILTTLFMFTLFSSGCGYLKKKEFERQFSSYKEEVSGNFTKVDGQISDLNKRVDQVSTAAKEDAKKAKEDAIAAAEQGDADTLEAANKKVAAGDKEVLEAAKKAAAEAAAKAEENAKKAAKSSIDDALGAAKKAADQSALQANTVAEKALAEAQKVGEALRAHEAKSKVASIAVSVSFRPGGTKIDEADKSKFQQIADAFKANPGSSIWVEGHTDATPVIRSPYRNNWELAEARAKSVKDYLTSSFGIPAESIKTLAKAHYQPVASQVSSGGMAQNRRVEVKVILPADGGM